MPGPVAKSPRPVPTLPGSGPPGDFIFVSATGNSYIANLAGAYQIVDVGSGDGDVVGPASSTDNAAARFDGITGKTLQNSALIIADTTGNISGLQQATFSGTTSGTAILKPAAIAGTTTSQLPTVSGTLANTTDIPYDLACQVVGVPDASAVVLRFIAVRAFTLSARGQRGTAGVAATAQTDFIVSVNAVTKATLRFAASGTTITVVGGTSATIAAGDIILITAPGSADATLANIGLVLIGVLI